MNPSRFDHLTRRLATTSPRRTIIKGLAASAATGLVALAGGRPTGAAPAPCVSFCQDGRQQFHDSSVCQHAGGRTTASFACSPQGNANGTCSYIWSCVQTTLSPGGQPADPQFCQDGRAFCDLTVCPNATTTSFNCSPALRQWTCACI